MTSAGSRVPELAAKLYDACLTHFEADRMFFQEDLLTLGVIPANDLALLVQCAQSLVDQKLMRLLQTKTERLAWKIIPREDAEKLQNLNPDESLVYNVIHSNGRSGVWVRAIQSRTGLHKSILDRCVKSLEGKNYIKSVHNVKYPSRKMYMLAGLAPSEDVTGGAWFTDGVMDVDFINSVAGYIEYTVSRKSWFEVPSSDHGRNKRLKTATGKSDIKEEKQYLPFAARYEGYPTVEMITAAVNESGITPVTLREESIVQLLEMLCYDKKLVALNNGQYYKAIKNPDAVKTSQARKPAAVNDMVDTEATKHLPKNGMTEVPCGQCPVFNLCSPGGAVSPETCEYFDPWVSSSLGF